MILQLLLAMFLHRLGFGMLFIKKNCLGGMFCFIVLVFLCKHVPNCPDPFGF